MTTTTKTSRRRALQLGLAATVAAPAVARGQQAWPPQTITWINPFPAGGGTDVFARPLAAQVGEQLGCQIIVDNKGGAGGTVGASQAAKMKPDGSVFFVGAIHHTIAPSVYKNLDYDLEKNFEPITMIALVPQVISINPNKIPVKTAQEFIAYVKANPNKVNYASPGTGTAHHLAGELFKLETKTEIVHVPYRGAGPAMQDLLAGNADMMFDGMGTSGGPVRQGLSRTLFDRRVDLPDRAGGRGGPARRGRTSRSPCRSAREAGCRSCRAAAAPRSAARRWARRWSSTTRST
jgi:tripartite-type tricarboxylate transporter receptor subunit TctC